MSISITIIIVIITCLISYASFQRMDLLQKLVHRPVSVKQHKEFYRWLTSGFIHGSWMHLGINMFVFWSFGTFVEKLYRHLFGDLWGNILFLVLYLGGIIASSIPSYLKHQDNPRYSSLGASGAVASVLFVYVLYLPWEKIYLYGVIGIYSIIAGVAYLIYEQYMSRREGGRINHDAHFWGAIFGIAFTIAIKPSLALHFIEQLRNAPFLGG